MEYIISEEKLRLALAIVSGRKKDFFIDDYNILGYDIYKFGCYGKPDENEVKREAENVIYNAIIECRKVD